MAKPASLAFGFLREVLINEGCQFGERVRTDVAKIVVDPALFCAAAPGA